MDEAIAAFERSMKIRPNYQAASNLGTLYFFEQQDYEKAAEAFRRALDLSGDEYVLWGNYAAALEWNRQTDAARKAYSRADELAEARRKVNASGKRPSRCHSRQYYAALGDRERAAATMRARMALEAGEPRLLYRPPWSRNIDCEPGRCA